MEEEDIRALSCWHSEPNFHEDVFQNSAMDRILSNSFMECFRVQKLFDTKARPRKPQINVTHKEPQEKINVYVPGGRVSVESSHRSQLFAQEQKEYLRLYLAYKYNGKNALQKQEEAMFNFLHQKVVEENAQYEEFVQAMMSTKEHVSTLPESIRRYTSEAWKFRLSEVEEYPALFKVIATLPLVSSLDGSLVKMKLENVVLEEGEAPCIFPPQFQSKLCCSKDYSNLCHDYPVPRSVRKMCPVSRDPVAEKLALSHNADIVISSSALQHIVDNYPNYDKVWDIPVVIKQLEHMEGPGNMKKIIFIDKALPPTTMTAEQRNVWFHKRAVKKLFFHQNNGIAKSTGKRPKFVAKKHNADRNNKRSHMKTRSEEDDDNVSVSEALTQSASESDDVDATEDGVDEANESSFQAGAKEDAKLSKDLDVLNLNCDDGTLQRGVKRKPLDTPRSSIIESGSDDESDESSSDGEGKLMIACDDDRNKQVKEKKSLPNIAVVKKKRTLSFENGDVCLPAKQGMLETETGTREEAVLAKESDEQCPFQKQEDGMQVEREELSCGQKASETGPSNEMEPETQQGVMYSIWQLCLQEPEKEDLKERILKKKIENKHLRVLVRCKVDGVKNVGSEPQKLSILPKLEHKIEYGAERLSTSEMLRSWVTLFFRPGVNLARVRIDAKTSEVLMFEETNLKELMDYASFLKFPVQSMALGMLYNVLTALDTYEPGTYLMSHRRDSFFNFLKADDENGRHNLKTVYQINCNEVQTSRKFEYLPIDSNVVMPRNVICGRVPGTFNPKKLQQDKKKKKAKKRNLKR